MSRKADSLHFLSYTLLSVFVFFTIARSEPELEKAFIFGSRDLDCPTYNDPSIHYTTVLHVAGDAGQLEYTEERGWGYEVFYDLGMSPFGDRNGFGIFGPFDDSPNSRTQFGDSCPEQIYDSFIGAKNFTTTCSAATTDGDPETPCSDFMTPEGIIFKVDVPNGKYRFVCVMGSADNRHAHRLIAEDGGSGPPEEIGDNFVVLVNNFDQAEYGAGNFAHVAFGCFRAPPAVGPVLHNIDEEGFVTDGPSSSPTLEVTEGYIRFHQLQGNSNDGAAGTRDPNGGDMVLLELWKVDDEIIPDPIFADATRTISPASLAMGDSATITLDVSNVTHPATVTETIPEGYEITDNGGGTAAGNTLTFNLTADGTVSYTLKSPTDRCPSAVIKGRTKIETGCGSEVAGDSVIYCEGALSASGGVLEQLVVGPVDLGGAAGPNCADNGNFSTTDYITNGDTGEYNLLAQEGNEIEPDFFGEAGGVGVATSMNLDINPNGANGILTVWTADADNTGYINFNDIDNIGDGTINYVTYTLVYLENLADQIRKVTIEAGSDDACKLYLNGDLLLTDEACHTIQAAGSGNMIPAFLLPGKNVLLTGIAQGTGGAGVRLIIRNPDGTPLTDGGVQTSLVPPAEFPSLPYNVTRTINPSNHGPGELITVTLSATDITTSLSIVETLPDGFTVGDTGGGTVDGNNLTFTLNSDMEITYTILSPSDISCDCGSTATISGLVSSNTSGKVISGDSTLRCHTARPVCAPGDTEPELVQAFAFGTHASFPPGSEQWCPTYNDPGINYTAVEQVAGDPSVLLYDEERGWGYEQLYDQGLSPFGNRGGFEIFGPFDDSPNARNYFPDDCPEELYDSFIGVKNFTVNPCDPANPGSPCPTPEGSIFRIDVPNGNYRFVAASGEPENSHSQRILAEDGGEGTPDMIGDNYVVLVDNFDQQQYGFGETINNQPGAGIFARVGFDDKIPPPGDGIFPDPQFVNMDEDGKATSGCARSPILKVTEGYIRIHQLQGNISPGCGSSSNDNSGGDLVLLELWKVEGSVQGPIFKRGDVNNDNSINLADAIYLLSHLFAGAAAPLCPDAADANDDGALNLADAITILGYLFSGTGPLPDPFDACGPDPKDDSLPECNYPEGNC